MRYIPPELAKILDRGDDLNVRWLVEMNFKIEVVHMHSGIGIISFQGTDWYGVGAFGGISAVPQKTDGSAATLSFTLSAIPLEDDLWDFLKLAREYCRQGDEVGLYIACVDDANQIIGEPLPLAATLMDVPTINDEIGTASVTISTESPLIRQQIGEGLRNTHEDQIHEFPGDLAFEGIAELQDRVLR